MAYKVFKKGNVIANPMQTEYICDNRSDIFSLPTNISWGASTFVVEDSSVWVLNSDGIWKEV